MNILLSIFIALSRVILAVAFGCMLGEASKRLFMAIPEGGRCLLGVVLDATVIVLIFGGHRLFTRRQR